MVTDEMVWKAAVAMCLKGGFDPYEVMPNDGPRWKYYVDGARAALEAALSAAEPQTAPSVAVNIQDGNRPLPYDRDTLGRFVREAWVRWAETQPMPKPSWLIPYDELTEADKEADRQIGEAVARWALIGDAARYSKIKEHLENIEATADAISSPYRNSIIRKNALSALSTLSEKVRNVEKWRMPVGSKRSLVDELKKARSEFMISDFDIAERIIAAIESLAECSALSAQVQDDSEIVDCLLAGKPFVFDPATNFCHADDGGAPEHGIKYVPAAQVQGVAEAPPVDSRHRFEQNSKYPWFCAVCGYAPHEPLKHLPAAPAKQEGSNNG